MAKKNGGETAKNPDEPIGAERDTAAAPEQDKVEDNPNPPPNPPGAFRALRIRTKRGVASFRRAGLAFGEDPTDVPYADLSAEQRAALMDEPMLRIEDVEIEVTD